MMKSLTLFTLVGLAPWEDLRADWASKVPGRSPSICELLTLSAGRRGCCILAIALERGAPTTRSPICQNSSLPGSVLSLTIKGVRKSPSCPPLARGLLSLPDLFESPVCWTGPPLVRNCCWSYPVGRSSCEFKSP
jgi:hypothetical protein